MHLDSRRIENINCSSDSYEFCERNGPLLKSRVL